MLKLQAKGVAIWGWQHLQKPSPKCHFIYICLLFLFRSTHGSGDCWSARRSSAARDSFKRVHDWCKAGWRRPGAPPPPNKNPGYANEDAYIMSNILADVHSPDFYTFGRRNFQIQRLLELTPRAKGISYRIVCRTDCVMCGWRAKHTKVEYILAI